MINQPSGVPYRKGERAVDRVWNLRSRPALLGNAADCMPFDHQPYPWSHDSDAGNVPRHAGVYGLFSAL